MYPSFPQAVTLMKKSGESLTVKPKVNLSTPISEIQAYRLAKCFSSMNKKRSESSEKGHSFIYSPEEGAGVQHTEV